MKVNIENKVQLCSFGNAVTMSVAVSFLFAWSLALCIQIQSEGDTSVNSSNSYDLRLHMTNFLSIYLPVRERITYQAS